MFAGQKILSVGNLYEKPILIRERCDKHEIFPVCVCVRKRICWIILMAGIIKHLCQSRFKQKNRNHTRYFNRENLI